MFKRVQLEAQPGCAAGAGCRLPHTSHNTREQADTVLQLRLGLQSAGNAIIALLFFNKHTPHRTEKQGERMRERILHSSTKGCSALFYTPWVLYQQNGPVILNYHSNFPPVPPPLLVKLTY